MKVRNITREEITSRLNYDPKTGVFVWRSKLLFSSISVGDIAGSITSAGYIEIGIGYEVYRAHHLAWFLTYGKWPSEQIDHIDGDRKNNAIVNLRDVSKTINGQNQKHAQRHNKLGVLGVTQIKRAIKNPYQVMIMVNGRPKYIGTFATVEQASNAYISAKRLYQAGCTI